MEKRGVLLAISALPGRYAIGDFSNEAKSFIDILNSNNINIWQILPLNPIGYGHSPYQTYSSFAFDEIYISIDDLVNRGFIEKVEEIDQNDKTDFELARSIKNSVISACFEKIVKNVSELEKVNSYLKSHPYIDEYCRFISLKEINGNREWNEWDNVPSDDDEHFNYLRHKHGFAQMILDEEWASIRAYAKQKGVEIIGDLPFYVGYDSSDVYFHKDSFLLDKENKPSCVAGVPPDYFSKTGQRWGNPIWNWELLYKNNFGLMLDRLISSTNVYDFVRLDHFRAFHSYWSINPKCETAVDGEWKYPDGHLFFDTLYKKYPNINIIAEDLGDMMPEVFELKDYYKLAGMRVVQFSIFEDEFIKDKRNEKYNQIFYTGTHDNETLNEWVKNLKVEDRTKLLSRMLELKIPGDDLCEKLIHYSLNRKEKFVIISIVDILNLDNSHRINAPGTINEDNWTFKLKEFDSLIAKIKKLFN